MTRSIAVARTVFLLGAAAAPLRAQAPSDTARAGPLGRADYSALIRAEQEASYISLPFLAFGVPRERHDGKSLPLLYEATIAPPFFIPFGRRPLLVAVTPKVVLRQFAGGSYPVPPPSYMPRVTAYWWGWPYRPQSRLDSASYAFLRAGHHSNGQEGDYWLSTTPPQVNYLSGDFVTNYMELGVSQRVLARNLVDGAQTLSVEWHPRGWMNRDIRPGYGPLRINLAGRLELLRGVSALSGGIASLTYIAGPLAPGRRAMRSRLAFGYTLFSDFGLLGDFSLFASYYTGQDYYNIRFDRSISTFRIGALAGARRFPH
jgi:hypothetical protein